MSAQIIDGKKISQGLREEVAVRAKAFLEKSGRQPGLATVLVGSDPASQTYVRMKHNACQKAGVESFGIELGAEASQAEIEAEVQKLADNPAVDGILVQLPLPKGIDSEAVLSRVPISKDVDGFHPINSGLLARRGCEPYFIPCTPWGCIHLLERSGLPVSGKRAVVLGRSNLVGQPVALLLQERDATVTVVHSKTQDQEELIKQADILVAAIGMPEKIKGEHLKPGCVVLDVGINKVDDVSTAKGYKLVGDVEFESAKDVAGWITPVPGGVGPMTIAVLLENTVKAAEREFAAGTAAVS